MKISKNRDQALIKLGKLLYRVARPLKVTEGFHPQDDSAVSGLPFVKCGDISVFYENI